MKPSLGLSAGLVFAAAVTVGAMPIINNATTSEVTERKGHHTHHCGYDERGKRVPYGHYDSRGRYNPNCPNSGSSRVQFHEGMAFAICFCSVIMTSL
ncbi:hypothetical protein F4808DRAFT_408270 [Astrocystis sublimbata]|nr:hypothetical protein F4808DRAFT_408270 [Astrocystis sublimbata]